MGSSQSRNADNEFFAGLMPLREATADRFPLSGPADTINPAASPSAGGGGSTAVSPSIGGSTVVTPATTRGWNVARFVEWGKIDEEKDERSYKPDKEYGFRPKFAPMVIDQVNYRHFANPPGGSPTTGKWLIRGDDVGFELSTVSDYYGQHKSEIALPSPGLSVKPIASGPAMAAPKANNTKEWNPSHMNSENRSTLLISRQPMETSDRDPDLPDRYFGRMVDVVVPWATQNITLKRVEFSGGDRFRKSTPASKDYTEGVFKGMWNITVDDRPIKEELDQKNEHDGGPGKHGFGPHKYISGLPVDAEEDSKREAQPRPVSRPLSGGLPGGPGSTVVTPSVPGQTAATRTAPQRLFQGGWIYDGVQDAMSQIHDIITVVPRSKPFKLPRWRNRFRQPIGITVFRHDGHFTKRVTELPPAPNVDAEYMSGRIYFTKPFQ